jgi:hypothetical protein
MAANYLTQDDITNFGSELIDVAQRASLHSVAPHVEALAQETADLRHQLAIEQRRALDDRVARAIPNYREIDADPRWHVWLRETDVLNGVSRQALLNRAIDNCDAARVIRFFYGFLQTIQNPGQAFGQVATSRTPRAQTTNGRIYTRPEIQKLYSQHHRGAYIGREAEWRALETDIIAAGREGRIRGALDLQTGLPTSL